MIAFSIKKTFFDLWDNMFKIGALNLGFLISISLAVIVPTGITANRPIKILIFLLGVLWCFIYAAAAARSLSVISDRGSFTFSLFVKNIRASIADALFSLLIFGIAAIVLCLVVPFYLKTGSFAGIVLAQTYGWFLLISIMVFQFFFAARTRLDGALPLSLKKLVMIFFDNPLFCIASLIICIIGIVLSVFTVFLFPGPAGILLYLDEAFRLRLLKYDWLESQNDKTDAKRAVPWNDILEEEREIIGNRGLKNLIFPWKD
ncbi:MAG: hypothetical protein LBC77_08880 [Spirochaetaceae bacterium]|jgi:hypothetical protein|nr:hypothetical protein [Spirochaetaceae bacterium]